MTRRIVQAIRALLDPPQSPQRALVDAACELHQLDYRLLEVMQRPNKALHLTARFVRRR